MKLDTEAAMLELDQILKANELSISLMAAVPSLIIMGVVLRWTWELIVARPPPDPKTEAAPCRYGQGERVKGGEGKWGTRRKQAGNSGCLHSRIPMVL